MTKYTAAEMARFEIVLKNHGFSLKTKALKSYIINPNNPNMGAGQYINLIKEFGFSYESALVYGVMLLNYNSNGSYANFGDYLPMRRASLLLNNYYSLDRRKNAFSYFSDTVRVRTYKRWLNVIKDINTLRGIIAKEQVYNLRSVKVETKSPETKELTLKQIETLLGYKIKLVA